MHRRTLFVLALGLVFLGGAALGYAPQAYRNLDIQGTTVARLEYTSPQTEFRLGTSQLGFGPGFAAQDWILKRITSNLASMAAGDSLAWEGATADAYETIVSSADIGQDTTWTFPDAASGAATFGDTTVTFAYGTVTAEHLDVLIFVADRAYIITDIDATWGTAESTGAMDIMVEKLVGVTACGSGTDTMSAAIDATATADTTTAGALHGTAANLAVAAGDTLCIDLSATPSEIANMVVTVALVVN